MSALRIGGIYEHPDYGTVRVLSGNYLVNGRISNWYEYENIDTGVKSGGYGGGGTWPDVSHEYQIVVVPKAWLEDL